MNHIETGRARLPADSNHKGDFLSLLKHAGIKPGGQPEPNVYAADTVVAHGKSPVPRELEIAHSTTVIAVRYRNGVMIAGDRRATAGTSVIYDKAEKVLQIDNHSVPCNLRFSRNCLRNRADIGAFLPILPPQPTPRVEPRRQTADAIKADSG